jgi:cobalt-precorrin 5A hydrolase / precorrin-3B C17-methyltransferase
MNKPVVFMLSAASQDLAEKLKVLLDGEIHGPTEAKVVDLYYHLAVPHLVNMFQQKRPLIAICASGIVVRALSGHLKDKHDEPPVVAVSEDGASIVPLLGGHHGANALARKIAAALRGHAAITTASDVKLGFSPDEPPPGYEIATTPAVKPAMAALVAAAPSPAPLPVDADWVHAIQADVSVHRANENVLTYHPKTLVVGIGCERGTDPAEVKQLIQSVFDQHSLAAESIAYFASIDLKEDEVAMGELGAVRFFNTKELNAESHRVLKPSEVVRAEVGTPSVAEAAALAGAGPDSQLIVSKTKSRRATCAIAEAPAPILEPRGRTRGVLHVVGLGPGTRLMRSPEASIKLSRATDWVGYDLYLDLAMDAYSGQILYKSPLGAEEARVRHAISLAKEGKRVALICSGDAGIYAMAALVYEVIAKEPARIAIDVVPGISAFQTAAARTGALIGHDFCCISLSDLLTPWETIEKRVKAAAYGDFVVAFYNPRSANRQNQLARAMDLLRLHRADDTPVAIASNLGREEEKFSVVRLDEFDDSVVDMLTIILVGSSQSRAFKRGDGQTYAFTPRGYEAKHGA